MPDFMVIKSADCTSEQESDIVVSLIYNGSATLTIMMDSVGALLTGSDEDVATALSYVGNGLEQVVLRSDEPLWGIPGDEGLDVLFGAQNLLDPEFVAAHADPPDSGLPWRFGDDCAAGTR